MATTTVDRDAARPVLVRLVRAMFPHERFPDGPYERTADAILDACDEDPAGAAAGLNQGLVDIAATADGDFTALDDGDALEVARALEGTALIDLVQAKTVLVLYDDREVWELLGYEGESFSKGGYTDRGFDDLPWLPTPRIEEAS